ncbi:MAG: FG-GAP repeat protein, partial [Acidobacteriota bacterium]
MKSYGHFRKITLALSLLAAIAFSLAWQSRGVNAAAEHKPAAAHFPDLQGKAAIEHLKQQGLYSSLRSAMEREAMSATLTTNYTPLTQITAFDGEDNDIFGNQVALSGDTIVIGAFRDDAPADQQGSVYVYVRSGNSYAFQRKLTADDGAASDYFGAAVAISGNTIVVGASGQNSSHGAAYVFVRSGTSWSQQQKLVDGALIAQDSFGYAVAISGDTIVVGAPYDDIGSNEGQGSAYVFTRSGTTWSQQQKLTAGDGTANSSFGDAVAISGNTLLVGASGYQVATGAAYVFTRSGATWSQQQKLTGSEVLSRFGQSVALDSGSANTAVIGAHYENNGQGAAFVFVRSGSSWSQQQKLTVADASVQPYFGFDVAIYGETVVIGAPHDSFGNQNDRGSAYVFTRSGATWSQQQKLIDVGGYQANLFGRSVALGADTILVGAPGKYSDRGATIAFAQPVNTPPTINALSVLRNAGTAGVVSNIANVSDAEDAEDTLFVAANGPVNGVTVSGLSVNGAGVVSATVAAACNATTANFNLYVEDSGGAFNVATLTVTVTPNTAPILSYNNPPDVNAGATLNVNPTSGPADNGVASLVVQSVTPSAGGAVTV